MQITPLPTITPSRSCPRLISRLIAADCLRHAEVPHAPQSWAAHAATLLTHQLESRTLVVPLAPVSPPRPCVLVAWVLLATSCMLLAVATLNRTALAAVGFTRLIGSRTLPVLLPPLSPPRPCVLVAWASLATSRMLLAVAIPWLLYLMILAIIRNSASSLTALVAVLLIWLLVRLTLAVSFLPMSPPRPCVLVAWALLATSCMRPAVAIPGCIS